MAVWFCVKRRAAAQWQQEQHAFQKAKAERYPKRRRAGAEPVERRPLGWEGPQLHEQWNVEEPE